MAKIYLKTRDANGNVIVKERKLVKYFEKEDFIVNGKTLYTYDVIPEEKDVPENAVPKVKAEYVSVKTKSNNNRPETIEWQGETVKVPKLYTPKMINSFRGSAGIETSIKVARKLFFENPTRSITVQICTITKEGEKLERVQMNINEFNNFTGKMLFVDKLDSYRQLKWFHVFNPKANNNYCIIDHVNSISGKKIKENGKIKDVLLGEVYGAAYQAANEDHFSYQQIYTMKKFCKTLNNSPNPSKKYKTWVRNNFYPKKVYLICDNISNYDAKYAYKLWTDRGVDCMVIQAEQFNRKYKFNNTNSIETKVSETWGSAVGWTFSAPLTRLSNENNIDTYATGNSERRKELIERGVKVTKVTTRADKFQMYNKVLATNEERKDAARNIIWKHKVGILPKMFIDLEDDKYGIKKTRVTYILEPDEVICECCGLPRNIHNHKNKFQQIVDKVICPHCETEFDDECGLIEIGTYFDDNCFDENEEYMDDIISSIDGYEETEIEE